jgi:hypothetical protein
MLAHALTVAPALDSIPGIFKEAFETGKIPERTGATISALFDKGGVDWARGVYKMLSDNMEAVTKDPLLSPEAKKHLRANITASMREIGRLGGAEFIKAIEEATLGAGAVELTDAQIAAAEELNIQNVKAVGTIRAMTLQLEILGFTHAKTSEAQIEAVEAQMEMDLALLFQRTQLANKEERLAKAEYDDLVKAVKSGKDIQIAAIEAVATKRGKTERDKLLKLAKENRKAGLETADMWAYFGIKSAKDFINPITMAVALFANSTKDALEETADLFGTDLAKKIGGSLGQLAGHFEEVPDFALAALEEIIAGSEAQLQAMADINVLADGELGPKFTDRQMEDMRRMIENVKELALAEAAAAVTAVRHQQALRGYADISARMVADANREALVQLTLQRAYAEVFETRKQNQLEEMEKSSRKPIRMLCRRGLMTGGILLLRKWKRSVPFGRLLRREKIPTRCGKRCGWARPSLWKTPRAWRRPSQISPRGPSTSSHQGSRTRSQLGLMVPRPQRRLSMISRSRLRSRWAR